MVSDEACLCQSRELAKRHNALRSTRETSLKGESYLRLVFLFSMNLYKRNQVEVQAFCLVSLF